MSTETSTAPTARDWTTKFGIKAYRYRALVKKRWWILAVAVSLGLLCEAWILIRQPVLFESVGNLVVGGGLETGGGVKYSEDQDGFYVTQVKILQSPTMLERTRQVMELAQPQLHGTIDILANIEARSKIFVVTGHGSNPDYTKAFVETLMQEFIKYRDEQTGSTIDSYKSGLKKELDETRSKLDDERKAMSDFSDKNKMAFSAETLQSALANLSSLKKQQADKATLLNQLKTLTADQILGRSLLGSQASASDPQNPGGGMDDLSQRYHQANQDLAQKKADLEQWSKVWKPEHPGIKKIKDDIANLQLTIKTLQDESSDSTKARIQALESDLKSLDATITDANQKASDATHLDSQYQLLKSAVTTTESLYNELMKSLETGGGMAPATENSFSIWQHASPPMLVPPGVVKHLLIGLVLGLIAGGAILYVIDRADDRISSSTEVVEHFSESILGQIPNVDESRVEAGLPLLQHDDPRYTFAEAFRSLRSSLIFMPNQGELKTIIVTSSIPGEGKSTITSNLAITMAIAGARVLVVDADLRRGDLASLFDVDGRIGLSSVLRGEVEWRNAVQKTSHPTLTLLPRGPVTNQSGELLLLPTFEPMMEDFKNNFDLILFNTSPILATDDTPTIAPHFDGTLMVIRAQFTGARLVHNSLNALYQRQVNVLGLILNCVDTEMPDYYYYRYPKYYAA